MYPVVVLFMENERLLLPFVVYSSFLRILCQAAGTEEHSPSAVIQASN